MNNQYLFNVQYYTGLYTDNSIFISQVNEKLCEYRYQAGNNDPTPVTNARSFNMKTVYPGLLLGIGNLHAVGNSIENSDDEIKLGFSLDYTTGLPYIPGSTVKGVIRSPFKRPEQKKESEFVENNKVREEAFNNRIQYIRRTIASLIGLDENNDKLSNEAIFSFEGETFGDQTNGKGDIFLDSFPVQGDSDGKLFSFESITPHSEIFKDPIPLRLLKIVPDVIFEFRFILKDSKVIPEMTAEKKIKLFQTIIADFGIGAKTNVGYGVMVIPDTKKTISVNATSTPAGICKKCGKKIEEDQTGNYCQTCAKERPKCQKCKKKKVDWDPTAKQWKVLCTSCQKQLDITT